MRPTEGTHEHAHLRAPRVADGAALWRLARDGGLDVNSPYAYLLLAHDFADTCVVAEAGDDLVGFVTGYRPPARPDTVFVWQVTVAATARGRGLGTALVDALLRRTRPLGVDFLEATVTPSNDASWRLFAAVADHHDAPLVKDAHFAATDFPNADHEDELLVRIGPFGAMARSPAAASHLGNGGAAPSPPHSTTHGAS